MMRLDSLIEAAATIGLLLLVGGAVGLVQRRRFSPAWLLVAGLLVLMNEAMLTRGFGLLPRLLPHAEWNWQGKILALAATLAVAALPAFGWRASGLTLRQAPGSLRAVAPVVTAYLLLFLGLALASPREQASPETLVFQLTMPGLEEEAFYRGLLLLALDRAFTARVRVLGARCGWGALLSSALFGLAHALSFERGGFSFDLATMAMTGLPALIAVWVRLRTGSILIPVLMHNFGNAVSLLV